MTKKSGLKIIPSVKLSEYSLKGENRRKVFVLTKICEKEIKFCFHANSFAIATSFFETPVILASCVFFVEDIKNYSDIEKHMIASRRNIVIINTNCDTLQKRKIPTITFTDSLALRRLLYVFQANFFRVFKSDITNIEGIESFYIDDTIF